MNSPEIPRWQDVSFFSPEDQLTIRLVSPREFAEYVSRLDEDKNNENAVATGYLWYELWRKNDTRKIYDTMNLVTLEKQEEYIRKLPLFLGFTSAYLIDSGVPDWAVEQYTTEILRVMYNAFLSEPFNHKLTGDDETTVINVGREASRAVRRYVFYQIIKDRISTN